MMSDLETKQQITKGLRSLQTLEAQALNQIVLSLTQNPRLIKPVLDLVISIQDSLEEAANRVYQSAGLSPPPPAPEKQTAGTSP